MLRTQCLSSSFFSFTKIHLKIDSYLSTVRCLATLTSEAKGNINLYYLEMQPGNSGGAAEGHSSDTAICQHDI